jgi:chorismate synthase
VRLGKTIASPVTMMIVNKDARLDDPAATPPLHRPRPGHADLAGSDQMADDRLPRNAGAGQRPRNGGARRRRGAGPMLSAAVRHRGFRLCRAVGTAQGQFEVTPRELAAACSRPAMNRMSIAPIPRPMSEMRAFINDQKQAKDTAGGIVEAHVFGCPIGLGSCMTWDGRLDSRGSPRRWWHSGVQGRGIRPGL